MIDASATTEMKSVLASLDWRADFPSADRCDELAPRISAETTSSLELISTREQVDVLQCTYRSEQDSRFVVEFARLPSEGRLASGENVDLADEDAFVSHYEGLGFTEDAQASESAGAAHALFHFEGEQSDARFVGGSNVISFFVDGVGVTRTEFANLVASVTSQNASRGVLEVFEVIGLPVEAGSSPTTPGGRILTTPDGEVIEVGRVVVQGDQIDSVEAVEATPQSWAVDVLLTPEGTQAWADAAERACAMGPDGYGRLALVVEDQILSAPGISDCESVEATDRVAVSVTSQADAEAIVESISQSG